ncbi:MAG TPA: hypothetical protein VF889_07495 [Bacteroidota bacterium]
MKFRQEKTSHTEAEEQELARQVRELAREGGTAPLGGTLSERDARVEGPEGPSDAYWQNLIVRTNQTIDHVTSPLAISLSWALRVAIPGVVAVLSFVIGLHYYAPTHRTTQDNLATAVLTLPDRVVDSVVTTAAVRDEAPAAAAVVGEQVFDVPHEEIAEYFIQTGNENTLVESLDDKQATALLSALAKQ